ncbi:putative cytochrome P450 6a17 [Folsomia candida]|uniref:Putative cytochrome P450 6a17 n=1 Tax=Folsomia candida TaxID=158441 RepID=A0A226ED30_FOLCA|nr:putative cytochrome P450 6a17 [Folsomia candida]
MPLREKLISFISTYVLLPLVTLYAYMVKNPKTQEYFESNGILYLGDVSVDYVNDFLHGFGTTEFLTHVYNRVKNAKADLAGCGLAGHNIIIARKPSLIKAILVKDASHFDRVHTMLSLKGDYIVSKLMVFMQGEDWRRTRAKFESAFTPSKVKRSFEQANQLGKNLVAYLTRELDKDPEKGIDFQIAAHKFSLDAAGSSTLNLNTASLQTRAPSRFEQISAKFFLSFDSFANWWKPAFIQWFPRIAMYFKLTVVDKEILQFYGHVTREKMQNSGGDKNSNDFVGLVHSTWQELYGSHVDRPDQEVWMTANLFGMVLPGYKTTQTLMAMCAYILARHQDVQDKLRDEINAMIESNGDEFNFAAVDTLLNLHNFQSYKMSLREKIISLISRYVLLPLVKLYVHIVKNPKTQEYFESNGILYLGDVSSDYANDFLNGYGSTEIWTKVYNRVKQTKADLAGCGFIGHNFIIPRKPSLIKSILVKDASHFDRVHTMLSLKGDYIVSKSMVFMQGEDWKKTRAKFESAFTPSKVKRSFEQANQLGKNLVAYLNRELDKDPEKGIDFRIAAHKFSLDAAGSSTLNLDTASLQTRAPSQFEKISAKFFLSFDSFANWWKPGLIQWFPRIATYFKLSVVDKEILQFYGHVTRENMKNSGGDKNANDFAGIRMALVQTKMMLCHVLKNFKLTPSPETLIPMKFVKSAFPVMDTEEVIVCCTKIE